MKKYGLVSVLILILSPGCTFNQLANRIELKEPQFSYLRHEIIRITDTRADVDFIINAYNPNPIGLKNVYVDYTLLTEGGQFLRGEGLPLHLAPAGDTEITVATGIVYADLIRAAGPVVKRVLLKGEYSVPVTIDGVIYGKPTLYDKYKKGTSLFSFNWEFSRTEEIPLPKEQIEDLIMQMMLNR